MISLLDSILGQRNVFRNFWRPREIFKPPRATFFKFFSKFVQDMLIVVKDFTLKTKSKKFFFDQKFFFSKIISNHHICLQTWFLRCLEPPWKLWKQRIYVKTSILLRIRFFWANSGEKVTFFTLTEPLHASKCIGVTSKLRLSFWSVPGMYVFV